MGKKRVLCGYGIDVDAAAIWINTCDGSPQNPTNVSRGVFGATVGVDRLLKLYDQHNIKTSWFIPAHTIESFPKQIAKIRDAGHEIGLHGYTHEHMFELSAAQQKDVMTKSIDVLTNFCGKKPVGYTAPMWAASKELIPLLEEHGVEYDHSFMHHDLQMYYAPDGGEKWIETNLKREAGDWMEPMSTLKKSKVVEVPANWHLDDWPPLQAIPGVAGTHGFIDPHVLEKIWLEQFDYGYREYDTFVFVMSIHPQVSGKPQVLMMHERIINYINTHPGVEWMTFADMVKEFKEGRMPGATVEGGSDQAQFETRSKK